MKRICTFAVLLAIAGAMVTAMAVNKITTKKVELSKSVRLMDKEPSDDANDPGYQYTVSVDLDWPVTVNGKAASDALNKMLIDSVLNFDRLPVPVSYSYPLEQIADKFLAKIINDGELIKDYNVVNPASVPALTEENGVLRFWSDEFGLSVTRYQEHNLVFFVESYNAFYGGAHGIYGLKYYAFDLSLDKPISLSDIVTDVRAVKTLLPKYDKRDAELRYKDFSEQSIDNFYITKGRIVFSFDPYVIGAYAEGIVEISVPLSTLRSKGLLTAYGKKFVTAKSKKSGKKSKKRKYKK